MTLHVGDEHALVVGDARVLCLDGQKHRLHHLAARMRRGNRNLGAVAGDHLVYLRKLLFAEGLRYRKNAKRLPGCPDMYLSKYRTAIFVNGCFWHRHKECKYAYTPKTRVEFWQKKFETNVERDKNVYAELTKM